MGNNIVEENPAQQSNAPSGPQGQGAGGGQDKVRKQARQLAYDVRYKVKQGFKDGQKTDPASLKQAFVSQLGRSPAPGPVKALAKKMLVGESYDFVDVTDTVKSSVANAIKSIFVENKKACEICGSFEHLTEDCPTTVSEALEEKKYKVRVTDKKTGRSYVRFADRGKISELRKNPNISSVEMTGYGTPYEGEKKKGSSTAAVKSGKGLADKDYDGDGKKETPTAEYKGSKDKAIKKALAKEEFIGEVNTENDNPSANPKKIDVMKGKNKVIINPNMGEQNELAPKADAKQQRVANMKKIILQKKMQAVKGGAGADIVAHNELEGEVISEKEVKVKDTRRVIDAIRAYDKSKDASKDATADSDEGHPEKAAKERKYAKKERGEIDKDDPNWKKRKYHTGMHGESYTKEDAQYGYDSKGRSLNPDDKPLKDQDDKQIANVTFDGGGPDGGATIKGSGDSREIPTFVALIKNKLRARGILVSHNVPEGETIEEGEKLAQKAYDRARQLGAKRRASKDPSGIYKSERAGYNLAQSQRSDNESPATQRGNQTGGGPKDFGFAKHKKNPVKSKSTGDTGRIGHAKKAQEKTSVGKSGKKLKTPKYKLSFQQRKDHHSDWGKRQELKDPKKNPKHTANTKKEEFNAVQSAVDSLDSIAKKEGLI